MQGAIHRPDAGRKRRALRAIVKLEALEGRALLSHVVPHALSDQAVGTAEIHQLRARNPHPGPILNEIGNGYAVKSPRFYDLYTGAKRAELNAAGARAFLDGRGNLQLVGIVAGPIFKTPQKAGQEEFYVWGIDRGNGRFPGPFPGKPNITFDSVVVVKVQQGGVTGVAQDLVTGKSIPIPASNISIGQFNVKVTLPIDQFTNPATLTSSVPKVNFWPRSALPPANFTTIASFAPEGSDFPIALTPGGPSHGHGHRNARHHGGHPIARY
ncbi:MAG: hypothetical protein NVSMB9_13080 [Isosphaeraceae bacterium]